MNTIISNDEITKLCTLINYYENVYFLCANNTAGNLIKFQQELFYTNKLIHIVSSNFEYEFHNQISNLENSLLIVVSVSGLFANAVQRIIETTINHKILITSNRKKEFLTTYNQLIYLSDESVDNDRYGIISKYGVTFFFDLLSEQYIYLFK